MLVVFALLLSSAVALSSCEKPCEFSSCNADADCPALCRGTASCNLGTGCCEYTDAPSCEQPDEPSCLVNVCHAGCESVQMHYQCDDSVECTVDICNPSGTCSYVANHNACRSATTPECVITECDTTEGHHGCKDNVYSHKFCQDGDPCTTDVCTDTGCVNDQIADALNVAVNFPASCTAGLTLTYKLFSLPANSLVDSDTATINGVTCQAQVTLTGVGSKDATDYRLEITLPSAYQEEGSVDNTFKTNVHLDQNQCAKCVVFNWIAGAECAGCLTPGYYGQSVDCRTTYASNEAAAQNKSDVVNIILATKGPLYMGSPPASSGLPAPNNNTVVTAVACTFLGAPHTRAKGCGVIRTFLTQQGTASTGTHNAHFVAAWLNRNRAGLSLPLPVGGPQVNGKPEGCSINTMILNTVNFPNYTTCVGIGSNPTPQQARSCFNYLFIDSNSVCKNIFSSTGDITIDQVIACSRLFMDVVVASCPATIPTCSTTGTAPAAYDYNKTCLINGMTGLQKDRLAALNGIFFDFNKDRPGGMASSTSDIYYETCRSGLRAA